MAVDFVLVKTAFLGARSRMWEKLEPHWQKLQQMNHIQRRMILVITLLLIINMILLISVSSGQSDTEVIVSYYFKWTTSNQKENEDWSLQTTKLIFHYLLLMQRLYRCTILPGRRSWPLSGPRVIRKKTMTGACRCFHQNPVIKLP